MKKLLNRLGSFGQTLPLLLVLAAVGAAGTFLPQGKDPSDYEKLVGAPAARAVQLLGLDDFYHSPWFVALLLCLVVNLIACMANRIPGMISSLRGEAALRRAPVLVLPDSDENRQRLMAALADLGLRARGGGEVKRYSRGGLGYLMTLLAHGSLLVIMASSLAGSTMGFIATQRIYVGDSTLTAYNWKTRRDMRLPFQVLVRGMEVIPNPIGLRLGVLEVATGKKGRLITTHEGDTFRVPGIPGTVTIVRFDAATGQLTAEWKRPDGSREDVAGGGQIGDSGLALVPVAFAAWPEKQVEVRADLVPADGRPRSGTLSVNHPVGLDGITVFLTDYGQDQFGIPYVGFQFVRDPGQWGVWTGSVLFLVCVTGALFTRHSCVVVRPEGGSVSVYLSSRGNREQAVSSLLRKMGTQEVPPERGDP
ncbi:MAG: cytochrome c biogenesis protein ResB [bacterium]|nr:MAG: cytochrome c biogenesis protein ResB [bacterium]